MDQQPNSDSQGGAGRGRGLGWTLLIVGIVLCIGFLSTVANGSSASGSGEIAGALIGKLIVLAAGIVAIVHGAKRLRRR